MEIIKNTCTALVLAGSIALLLAASCGSEEPAEPTRVRSSREGTSQKWDYEIGFVAREELHDSNIEKMSSAFKKRGQEGWEYAGIVCPNGANAFWHLWKRPID